MSFFNYVNGNIQIKYVEKGVCPKRKEEFAIKRGGRTKKKEKKKKQNKKQQKKTGQLLKTQTIRV